MKKLLSLLLVLCLLLCGCGSSEPETTVPDTEPETTVPETTEPETTEPETTEPVYTNPLNGQVLAQPFTERIFAVSINNISPALPFQGVSQADIVFEMLVNDYATRCLALFSNVQGVSSIGSIRSGRKNFVDIGEAYDAIIGHAGYASVIRKEFSNRGVDNLNLGNWGAYRDQNRLNSGYALEHTLFVTGQKYYDAAVKAGFSVEQPEGKDYGLSFVDDATPAAGEDASEVTIWFWNKKSIMTYNEELGKYEFSEYGKDVTDENTGEKISFENVIVMLCQVNNEKPGSYTYHVADVHGSGEGYFACNGKIIPIQWHHENKTDPFTFTLTDGTPLEIGVGNTYIAIAPDNSEVEYQ